MSVWPIWNNKQTHISTESRERGLPGVRPALPALGPRVKGPAAGHADCGMNSAGFLPSRGTLTGWPTGLVPFPGSRPGQLGCSDASCSPASCPPPSAAVLSDHSAVSQGTNVSTSRALTGPSEAVCTHRGPRGLGLPLRPPRVVINREQFQKAEGFPSLSSRPWFDLHRKKFHC